jgi:phage FluMu protein Com
MPIKFHCEHCGKSISAPDGGGGHKGKCPSCGMIVYVPAPEAEEIDLAPMDESEERSRQRLIEEDLKREHDLLMAQGRTEKTDDPPVDIDERHGEGGVVLPPVSNVSPPPLPAGGGSKSGAAKGPSTQDLRDLVVSYLAAMADGQLDVAQGIVARLKAEPRAARIALDQFISDPVSDPRIATLPPPVRGGFLKQLQQAIR